MKRTGPINEHLRKLVAELKKLSIEQKVGIWKRIALELERPTRQRRVVNLSRINRYTKENETVIIPGKVLGSGMVNHNLIIAAWSFSDTAKEKLAKLGKCMTIPEIIEQNPKGKGIRIFG